MGNQLVGIAPSQIFPVERYLADHPELKFDISLGSTRFFKVARAHLGDSLVVVKVFVIHDPLLRLTAYRDQLEDVRKRLASAINCIPFQKIILADKAAFIIREYVKHSLYDRLSTRPFLAAIEKRWFTFQLLYALHQCHKVGVCHGDLKLENVAVTSWNWVLLVDFASFKPTFVPEDNPADYAYFFDTSRRRTCYIAPERFANATTNENSALIKETLCENGELTPAMDIFSTGCVLLELWNELQVPFEYSQLLAYRLGTYTPQKHLDNLKDPHLRSLIESMLQIDPAKRLSAEDYLANERGRLFPEYFFTFLQSYMLIFSTNPFKSCDEKMKRLKNDIGNILKYLGPVRHANEELGEKFDLDKTDKGECEGLVIVIALVTSCIRGLIDSSSKFSALEILLELTTHANDETILDRILPYIMYLARDDSARVKIAAIDTITQCLDLVQQLPRSDSNIFPEYILPGLAPLAVDPNTCVRAAYAKNIATLAEIALRYLDQIQADWYDNSAKKNYTNTFNYELELQALHEMIEQTVSCLLSDSQAIVKQTLIVNGITKLCVFFGKQKSYDVLLSHMITFLNDKEDKQVRGAFFDSIIGVVTYIGWHCSTILVPLLLQGLSDTCEFVTMKAVNAMCSLTELGLLTKSSICELVNECSLFLVHPNLWIRHAVVGFITSTTKVLPVLDVQCKIMPNLRLYMRYPVIQIDKPELLLESLEPPISRIVFDSVTAANDLTGLLDAFERRKAARAAGRIMGGETCDDTQRLLLRLQTNGLSDAMEAHLLRLAVHVKKINHHKTVQRQHASGAEEGKIRFDSAFAHVHPHVFNLREPPKADPDNRLQRTNTSGSIDTNINSDWNYSSDMTRNSESTNSTRSNNSRPGSPPPEQYASTDPSSNMSLHERSYIQYRRTPCYLELSKLRTKQQEHFMEALRIRECTEHTTWDPLPPPEWSLRGVLVAHLHEHRSAVNRLCTIPDKPYFLSCSADGCVRLWDCAKMEGKTIANRAQQHYRFANSAAVSSMAICEGGQSVGAATDDGAVHILRLLPTGSKMVVTLKKQLTVSEEGVVVDMQYFDCGIQSVLVYATLYGSIVGWDLRSPLPAWTLDNGIDKGYISTFCIDSRQSLLTLGTSNGLYRAFDLRFQLPINSFEQPNSEKINKIINHPTETSWIVSSVHGNNKISMYNLQTKSQEKVLWGSTAPPLSQTMGPSSNVCALYGGCIDRSPFILSGGTDQRLRFWDLDAPEKSHIVAPAANDHIGSNVVYESRMIDGYHVICENANERGAKEGGEEAPRGGPEQPPAGHRDCVTDITLCKASQCFMVSASKDGIIKVWK